MGLLNTSFEAKLKPGKYPITISDYKEMHKDESAKGEPLDYIQLTVSIDKRNPIKLNFFSQNIKYLGSSLRNQLKREDAMGLVEILDEAVKAKDLWCVISYNEYGMNTAFHEKVVEASEEVKA